MDKYTRDVVCIVIMGVCFCFTVYKAAESKAVLTLKCNEKGLSELSLRCA